MYKHRGYVISVRYRVRIKSLLLKLVALSLSYSCSINTGAEPHNSVMLSTMAFHLPAESPAGKTIEQADMAPALTKGVEGWSFSNNMANIELNGNPVASAPILFNNTSGPCCHRSDIIDYESSVIMALFAVITAFYLERWRRL